MGGAWESRVKSVKTALKSTLEERAPKDEVHHTLLLEAERDVNSRLITYVSADGKDPESLTSTISYLDPLLEQQFLENLERMIFS